MSPKDAAQTRQGYLLLADISGYTAFLAASKASSSARCSSVSAAISWARTVPSHLLPPANG